MSEEESLPCITSKSTVNSDEPWVMGEDVSNTRKKSPTSSLNSVGNCGISSAVIASPFITTAKLEPLPATKEPLKLRSLSTLACRLNTLKCVDVT